MLSHKGGIRETGFQAVKVALQLLNYKRHASQPSPTCLLLGRCGAKNCMLQCCRGQQKNINLSLGS